MKLKKYILAPNESVSEMTYEGNIGFQEMVDFYRKANDTDTKKMEDIVEKGDWENFKKLIRKVTGSILM